jgi:hypothetical protein
VRLFLFNDPEAYLFVELERSIDLHHPEAHRLSFLETFISETREKGCADATALVLGQAIATCLCQNGKPM